MNNRDCAIGIIAGSACGMIIIVVAWLGGWLPQDQRSHEQRMMTDLYEAIYSLNEIVEDMKEHKE